MPRVRIRRARGVFHRQRHGASRGQRRATQPPKPLRHQRNILTLKGKLERLGQPSAEAAAHLSYSLSVYFYINPRCEDYQLVGMM